MGHFVSQRSAGIFWGKMLNQLDPIMARLGPRSSHYRIQLIVPLDEPNGLLEVYYTVLPG